MHPTCGGRIASRIHGDPVVLTVTTSIRTPVTTVIIQEWIGATEMVAAHIELDDEARRDAILALGGTP